jgi:Flp pilus assembly protein TadD
MSRAAEFAAKGFSVKNLGVDDAKQIASLILEVNGPQKKFAETVEAYQKWADRDPKSEIPLNWIAYVRTLEGRDDEAIVILTKAFEVSGKSNAATALDLGKACGRRGDVKAAVGWFKKAHELRKTWDTPA